MKLYRFFISKTGGHMDNIIITNYNTDAESADIENGTCAFSLPRNTVRKTIGKTTYIANLHFKEQGQTFAQKLKRVLRAEAGRPIS